MTQKTSILGRISQLAKANINALLDRAEDPEKMLNQLVADFTNSIAEAEEAVAQTIANTRMADALKAKGYPYQFVFSEASGHVDRRVQLQTMPEAFEWVWKGYKATGR